MLTTTLRRLRCAALGHRPRPRRIRAGFLWAAQMDSCLTVRPRQVVVVQQCDRCGATQVPGTGGRPQWTGPIRTGAA